MKKFFLYFFSIISTLGLISYAYTFGPLDSGEYFPIFHLLFIFCLPFYALSAGYTMPYSLISVFLIYRSMVNKRSGKSVWLHFMITGVWQLVLAFSYFGLLVSGFPIMA